MEPKGPDRSEWVFETGDPSVGIFGDYWIHEACPVPEPEVGRHPRGRGHRDRLRARR